MPTAEQRLCLFIQEKRWVLVFWPAFFATFSSVVVIYRICSKRPFQVERRSTSGTRGVGGSMTDLSESENRQMRKQVWQSLCSEPDSIASLDWHSDVLAKRRQRLLDGTTTCLPWDEAKARLQRLAE